jgi:hypothetical protein
MLVSLYKNQSKNLVALLLGKFLAKLHNSIAIQHIGFVFFAVCRS